MGDWRKQIVRQGYDATVEAFAAARDSGSEQAWLRQLIAEIAPGAAVLDLGCGNGWPVTVTLAQAGLAVTGVDISVEQVLRATARLPGGRFVVGDMTAVDFPRGAFAGAVAWDSIFHLPPAEHAGLFGRVHGWLAPGTPFLLTLGGSGGELHTEHLGAPMYFGALAPEDALRALTVAGFTIIDHVVDDPGDHGHLVVLTRA